MVVSDQVVQTSRTANTILPRHYWLPEVQKRNRAKGRRTIETLDKGQKRLELKVLCLSLKAHAESFMSERVISSSRIVQAPTFLLWSISMHNQRELLKPTTCHRVTKILTGWERGEKSVLFQGFKQHHDKTRGNFVKLVPANYGSQKSF